MSKDKFFFSLLKKDGYARLGKIHTSRGEIDTPTFMTVGTQGTIKSTFMEDVIMSGAQIILSNTYHLMLRPGASRIKRVLGSFTANSDLRVSEIFSFPSSTRTILLPPTSDCAVNSSINVEGFRNISSLLSSETLNGSERFSTVVAAIRRTVS